MNPCHHCDGDNPSDAQFCIDCGAPLLLATTGQTLSLRPEPIGVDKLRQEKRTRHRLDRPMPLLFLLSVSLLLLGSITIWRMGYDTPYVTIPSARDQAPPAVPVTTDPLTERGATDAALARGVALIQELRDAGIDLNKIEIDPSDFPKDVPRTYAHRIIFAPLGSPNQTGFYRGGIIYSCHTKQDCDTVWIYLEASGFLYRSADRLVIVWLTRQLDASQATKYAPIVTNDAAS